MSVGLEVVNVKLMSMIIVHQARKPNIYNPETISICSTYIRRFSWSLTSAAKADHFFNICSSRQCHHLTWHNDMYVMFITVKDMSKD